VYVLFLSLSARNCRLSRLLSGSALHIGPYLRGSDESHVPLLQLQRAVVGSRAPDRQKERRAAQQLKLWRIMSCGRAHNVQNNHCAVELLAVKENNHLHCIALRHEDGCMP
jgi:hypothetical protein